MQKWTVPAIAVFLALTTIAARPQPLADARLIDDTFNNPVYVTRAPGAASAGLLFVVEQPGVIRVLDREVEEPVPFLNISNRVSFGGERGLLSVAFDPGYATNRLFYVAYTNNNGDVQVDEYKRSATNPKRANSGSRRTVIIVPHREASNHNGGQLQFGPDGLLYISIGDGGADRTNARRLGVLLGKLLRINPTPQGNRAYTIPAGNPFVGQSGRRPEIFSYGLRNPWRFTFDGNRIAIADVGAGSWEEINFLALGKAKGANFGWPQYEGRTLFDPDEAGPHPPTMPMRVYSHSNGGCAVIGGYVARDPALPALQDKLLYGDLCTGRIFALTPDFARNRPADVQFTGITRVNLSSFGIGPGNKIYITQTSGELSRIVPH